MAPKLDSDLIVDVIEASIRVLVDTGLSRDEALQVMLSQVAAQVSPEVMKIATDLNEKYHRDFRHAEWDGVSPKQDKPVGSAEFAFGPL